MAVRQFSTLAAMHFIEMRGIFRRRRRARLPCCDATSKVTQERLRLASDLHDTVGHGLILIAMQARHLSTSSPSLRSQLREIEEGAQDSLQEIRRVVGGLHAVEERERSLTHAVADIVRRVPTKALHLAFEIVGDEELLDASIRAAAVRVVKEGITNALKYAHGQRAVVILSFGESLAVIVRSALPDDRQGTTYSGQAGSGLAGLRAHVASCGGTFRHGRTEHDEFTIFAEFGSLRVAEAADHGRLR